MYVLSKLTCNLNKKLYNWQTPDFKLCIRPNYIGLDLELKFTARRYVSVI